MLDLSAQKFYGFNDLYSGYFRYAIHSENEVLELGDVAETCSASERRKRRFEHEDKKWDEDYYMYAGLSSCRPILNTMSRADYADDEYIKELLHWKNPIIYDSGEIVFTDAENLTMLRLPRKEC
jgi:protein SHQ1